MEVFTHKDDFLKMFSEGIEEEYKGKSIVYNDNTKTFIFYYYQNHKKLYITDGTKKETALANVNEKIRIIGILRNGEVSKFNKYLKSIIKSKQIFYMDEDFFIDVIIAIRGKAKFSDILQVFNKYKYEKEIMENIMEKEK